MQTNDAEAAEAILAVIDAESRAFWDKDLDAIAGCWAHEPWIMRAGWWQRGGITWRQGWADAATRFAEHFANHPEPNPTMAALTRENIVVRVGGEMAWVTFDQVGVDTGEPDMDMPGVSHETRILERREGAWKLVYMSYLLT